ncbi:MAG: DUF4011 domain-containing protein, partial [Crocinitomicaceae bacterium]|nr:DUF4011 domain-containing protein [Crocinitomicaceae bacterium]
PLCDLNQKSGLYPISSDLETEPEKIILEIDADLKKVIRKHNLIKKETGLNTLYLSLGTIDLAMDEFGTMPLYLVPVEITILGKEKIELVLDWENKVMNPLLIKVAREKLNIEINPENKSSDDAFLGIFNYKKYILLDEIGAMHEDELSNPIRQLFDFNPDLEVDSSHSKTLEELLIDQADASQRKVIQESLTNQSYCIQGPPGTGKSQSITNIIAANLFLGKKILFVSEKKAAIDVVYEKLKSKNLHHHIAKVTDSGADKKNFVKSLEKQWTELKKKGDFSLTLQEIDASYSRVQLFLDHLFRFRNELGGNLQEALKNYQKIDIQSPIKSFPNLKEWFEFQNVWQQVLKDIQSGEIQKEELFAVLNLNTNLWKSQDFELKWDSHLKILKSGFEKWNALAEISDEFDQLSKICIQARLITGLRFKEKIEILNNEKTEKKYKRISVKYLSTKAKWEVLQLDLKHWIKIPSLQTIDFLETYLNKNSLLSTKGRKAKNLLIEHAGTDAIKDLDQLFQATKDHFELEKELISLRSQLKTDFQIQDPEREIDELNLILAKSEYQKELFDQILGLSADKIHQLDELNPVLDQIQHSQRVLFRTNYSNLKDLQKAIAMLPEIKFYCLRQKDFYADQNPFSTEIIQFLKDFSGDWKQVDQLVHQLNFQKIIDSSIILKETTPKSLLKDIEELIKRRNQNNKTNSKRLKEKLGERFQELENLLITPAGRLNNKEKELKKIVRSGKRILTHEFSKTKRFKSIRELCESDSKHWIFNMKNVWMMNPLSVSEILPFEKEQFDLLIIDEASQIPEEDIIPALYRAKQVIIVGDKMQMPPSNFFSGNEVGPSILDTANYRLDNHMLRWHYRSKNPQLIQFSNHAFYDSQLEVSPTMQIGQNALEYHFVSDSNYHEGINPKEAESIRQYLEKNLANWESKIIGVAAFSLAQQKQLEKSLLKSDKIASLIEDESLFVRNLENLQGDECDVLLISIGYGPDEKGNVSMNMGSLSKNGGHNRLNVLITRAREEVHVFSSIPNEAFKLSENEGLNYLKEYLEFVQNPEIQEKTNPSYSLTADGKKVTIPISVNDPEILISRVSILEALGFSVEIADVKNEFLKG